MGFSKKLMSITELSKLGYPKSDLKCYVNVLGCPIVKTKGGGKNLIDTDEFPLWLEEHQKKLGILKAPMEDMEIKR